MEENPSKKRSIWKWFFRILLMLFVLLIALFFWKGDYLLEKAVTDKLYENYFDVPTGNYDYELEQLDINVYARSISLNDLRLFPKEQFLDEVKYKGLQTTYLSVFSVKSLEVTGLRLIRFIRKGELIIGGVEIAGPVIQLNLASDTAVTEEETDTTAQGSGGNFSLTRIDRMEIRNGDVEVYDLSDNMQLLFSADSTNLNIRNIRLDKASLSGSSPIDFRSIDISSRFLEACLPDNQVLSINRFSFNSDENYLYTDTFLFKTRGFRPETGRTYHGESAFQIAGKELNILGFDLKSLYRDNSVAAEEFRIDGLSAVYYMQNESEDIYEEGEDMVETPPDDLISEDSVFLSQTEDTTENSMEFPVDRDSVITTAEILEQKDIIYMPSPLPSSIIRDLPLPLSLRDILINDASVEFRQFEGTKKQPGEMIMDDINIRISGLSNDQRAIRRNQAIIFDMEGRIYNTGRVKVIVDLPLGEEDDRMDMYVKLGSMPFTELNRMAESTGILRIRSGQIDSLECRLTLNRDSAWGDMTFVYQDLHIRLMKEIDRRKKLHKKQRILTLAANGLIKNNNDPEKSSFRQGDISYRRAPGESFSSFLTFSLVQGLAASLAPAIENRVIEQQPQE